LVHVIAKTLDGIGSSTDLQVCASGADTVLTKAVGLHNQLTSARVPLKEESQGRYQSTWQSVLTDVRASRKTDFDYLALLA
jgi:hypothetical protein